MNMTNKSPEEVARGLRIHAIVFAVVMIGLIILNLILGQPYWFWWVLLGWGIGLASHWFFTRSKTSS